MVLPTGLLPVLVFVLTAGVALVVSVGARLLQRGGSAPFRTALRDAIVSAGVLYLVGVLGVWAWSGFGALWGVPAALVAAGVAALLVFVLLPLAVGQWLLRRHGDFDPGTALRYATDGWLVAMLVVFGLFVAPGGLLAGDLLDLGGPRTCLLGHCGISVRLVGAVVLQLLVAVVGPAVVGLVIRRATRTAGRQSGP